MADPELEWGLVFNADGSINILRSPCFDVGFEDETTVEEYLERVVPILTSIYDHQLSKHTWSLEGHLRHPSPPATFPPTRKMLNFFLLFYLVPRTCIMVHLKAFYLHSRFFPFYSLQKSMLLRQTSWQNNVRMSHLVEQIRSSLSSIKALSEMLSLHVKRSEIAFDIVEDILVQGDSMKDAIQQLQDAVHLTKVICFYHSYL
ncbi:uncharacterized protein LOC110112904 [Dendrobium catenatum]|uniref:uncharacterized protein LOC110112904 n=1 Tax=Dendrobium catenatum TaxID=906689 RepID=UPI00109FCAB6|nr:uncharacterized protein LOC110112904 [Dendrobium catenatum]